MSKIAFRERGDTDQNEDILICLHGYAGSTRQWEPVADILSKNFKVVVPNLTHLSMGFEKAKFSEQVDELAHFIKTHYSGKKVSLCGISYGGALTWGVATTYPEMIHRVVLINPMPPNPKNSFAPSYLRYFFSYSWPTVAIYYFFRSRWGKNLLQEMAMVFRNLSGESTRDRVQSLEGRRLQFVCHMIHKFAWILNNENWSHWHRKLNQWSHNTLLIFEVYDPLFLESFYRDFAKRIKCKNTVITQGAGHISIVQESRLVAGAIREFLLRDPEDKTKDFAS